MCKRTVAVNSGSTRRGARFVIESTDPLPKKAPVLLEFSRRFLEWLDKVRLEDKTKTYYRDGW
jgi:hypothetical protein